MRAVLSSMLLFITVGLLANDTLTRAQVYNFNVGDTFDYKYVDITRSVLPTTPWDTVTSYSRYVVTSQFYSPDSATMYIQRQQTFPAPAVFDTLILNNLSGIEMYEDSTNCFYNSFTFDSAFQYNNRIGNELRMSSSCYFDPYWPSALIFVEGLGKVLTNYTGGIHNAEWNKTLELMYYSKGSETWGSPYYDFPTGIQEMNLEHGNITLFPTLNNGTFILKISDTNLLPANLIVYDVAGREMKPIPLTNSSNEISIQPCNSGVYLWKANNQGKSIQTGMIVVH